MAPVTLRIGDHRLAFFGVAALLVGGAATTYVLGSRSEQGGPLAHDGAMSVELPLDRSTTATWGSILPRNQTGSDIIIEAIEPVEVTGIEILGIVLSDPARGAVGTAYGFPPAGLETNPVAGARYPPESEPDAHRQVLIGVRRTGAGEGRIAALRIRYESEGRAFETTLNLSLVLVAP